MSTFHPFRTCFTLGTPRGMLYRVPMHHVLLCVTLVFWALWYLSITLTNMADCCAQFDIAPWAHRFRAGNLDEVYQAVTTLRWPARLGLILFLGVIALELTSTVLFGSAAYAAVMGQSHTALGWVAVIFGISVWGLFLLADSLFRTYQFTVVHFVIFCAHVLTAGWLEPPLR